MDSKVKLEKQLELLSQQTEGLRESLYCLCKHVQAFHEQDCNNQTADFGKPCVDCPRVVSCQVDWMKHILPIAGAVGLRFKLGAVPQKSI